MFVNSEYKAFYNKVYYIGNDSEMKGDNLIVLEYMLDKNIFSFFFFLSVIYVYEDRTL